MGRSAPKSLSSLSLGPKRKVKCYNGYFVNGYVFHTEEYGQGRKTYNCGVFSFLDDISMDLDIINLFFGIPLDNGIITKSCVFEIIQKSSP